MSLAAESGAFARSRKTESWRITIRQQMPLTKFGIVQFINKRLWLGIPLAVKSTRDRASVTGKLSVVFAYLFICGVWNDCQ